MPYREVTAQKVANQILFDPGTSTELTTLVVTNPIQEHLLVTLKKDETKQEAAELPASS